MDLVTRLRPLLIVALVMCLGASACGSDAAGAPATPTTAATTETEVETEVEAVATAPNDEMDDDDDDDDRDGGDHAADDDDGGDHAADDQDDDHSAAISDCSGLDVAFAAYIDAADMSCDNDFLYVETDNLADHEMMVGITAWNGQVPIAQAFYASNSWAIPLNPAFNDATSETTGQGPIAVAINGVMIFNPTQQSGIYSLDSDPNLIGELDECGGHSGRGDDYHYHVAPTCLEADQLALDAEFEGIVAYAMDGYPIYTNAAIPAGAELDACGGLGASAAEYRYFAQAEFPYVNGCFRGDFDMDLQPHAPSIREIEPGTPQEILITAQYTDDDGTSHMEYLFDGVTLSVNYIANGEGCFDFEFVDDISTGVVRRSETYCRR